MTGHIIESIGRWGIKSTDLNHEPGRLSTPKPGDIIQFYKEPGDKKMFFAPKALPLKDEAIYPLDRAKYGRINYVNENEIHVCSHLGSAFLAESGGVSISGGPFTRINLDDIEPAGTTYNADFWNWGNNSAGAGQGVHFMIARPLFFLKTNATQPQSE